MRSDIIYNSVFSSVCFSPLSPLVCLNLQKKKQKSCPLSIICSHFNSSSVKFQAWILIDHGRQCARFQFSQFLQFLVQERSLTSSLLLSLKDRDRATLVEVPVAGVPPRTPVTASSCWPNSSSTERTSIWYCCCRTAIVQMLGFPRTFSSGIGFQKKLRTRRFFLPLWLLDMVCGRGGGAPGGGGGSGGGGGASCLVFGVSLREGRLEWVCPDIEDGSEVVIEEVVQLLPSLLHLSGSLVEDGQLITSITEISCQHMCSVLWVSYAVFSLFQNDFQRTNFLWGVSIHPEEHQNVSEYVPSLLEEGSCPFI